MKPSPRRRRFAVGVLVSAEPLATRDAPSELVAVDRESSAAAPSTTLTACACPHGDAIKCSSACNASMLASFGCQADGARASLQGTDFGAYPKEKDAILSQNGYGKVSWSTICSNNLEEYVGGLWLPRRTQTQGLCGCCMTPPPPPWTPRGGWSGRTSPDGVWSGGEHEPYPQIKE